MLPITPILIEPLLSLLQILSSLLTLLLVVRLTKLVAGLMHLGHVLAELLPVASVAMTLVSAASMFAPAALVIFVSLGCKSAGSLIGDWGLTHLHDVSLLGR